MPHKTMIKVARIKYFSNLGGTKRNLDAIYKHIKNKDQDWITVISGYEGVGKSTFFLHMFTYWIENVLGEKLSSKHIHYVGDNAQTFIKALKKSRKCMMVAHDEAGKDMYSRKAMTSFSTDINTSYMVIRGKNLYTVFLIPNLLDLDTFFRKRRVKDMYFVYKRGNVAYYNKRKLRLIVPNLVKSAKYNEDPSPMYATIKTKGKVHKIQPTFYDTFRKYDNKILLEPYIKRKNENMELAIKELSEKYEKEQEKKITMVDQRTDKRNRAIARLIKQGMPQKDVAALFEMDKTYVCQIKKKYINLIG